jgi:SAM-dependent methyltransferase
MKKRCEYYAYADGSRFINRDLKDVFDQINKEEYWIVDPAMDPSSGTGSTLKQTREIVNQLPRIMDQFNILNVLDIPCGDFNWIWQIDWTGRRYLGADILEELIRKNIEKYQNEFITFKVLDLINDNLPEMDLVFCRDCLVHFSFDYIKRALANIKKSGSRFLLTTTFPGEKENEDIITGGWRPINLCAPPFDLPEPVYLLNEHCTEASGIFADKSLGLWQTIVIPDFHR